jgi:hypothetical protein
MSCSLWRYSAPNLTIRPPQKRRATSLFPSEVVTSAEPLCEVIGKAAPFLRIANTAGGQRKRQHCAPVRPAVERHSNHAVRGTPHPCSLKPAASNDAVRNQSEEYKLAAPQRHAARFDIRAAQNRKSAPSPSKNVQSCYFNLGIASVVSELASSGGALLIRRFGENAGGNLRPHCWETRGRDRSWPVY